MMEVGKSIKLLAYGCEYIVTITAIDATGIWGDYQNPGMNKSAYGLWPWSDCKKIEVIV